MRRFRLLPLLALLLLECHISFSEVVRVEIQKRDDAGTHERIIGRVVFRVDPELPANRGITDLEFAQTNKDGMVEFSSDLLFFRPKNPRQARGTAFVEVVNRGRDQSLALLSAARQRDLSPEAWDLGDRFLLEQGFTVAFLGWQFDVRPAQGLTFDAPIADVGGVVRDSSILTSGGNGVIEFGLGYCSAPEKRNAAKVTFRKKIDQEAAVLPRSSWDLAADGCSVRLHGEIQAGLYETIYYAKGSPVAGLGLAAMRDFASYLKHAPGSSPLRANGAAPEHVIGFGYSQSGRFLREFVRDGFNADERGRIAFDGLMISSAVPAAEASITDLRSPARQATRSFLFCVL